MVGLLLARPDVRRDVELGRELRLGVEQLEEQLSPGDLELFRAEWSVRHDVCQLHHGPTSECDHDTWYAQRTVCLPAMALAAAERRYDDLHEKRPYHDGTFTRWAKKPSARTPYHYRDGVAITVSREDLTPDDTFLPWWPERSDIPFEQEGGEEDGGPS